MEKQACIEGRFNTRENVNGRMIETGVRAKTFGTFVSDTTRLWNQSPNDFKACSTVYQAKNYIKKYVRSFPI